MSVVTLPGYRLAGLIAETCKEIQRGNITLDELALFNRRKNPFDESRPRDGSRPRRQTLLTVKPVKSPSDR